MKIYYRPPYYKRNSQAQQDEMKTIIKNFNSVSFPYFRETDDRKKIISESDFFVISTCQGYIDKDTYDDILEGIKNNLVFYFVNGEKIYRIKKPEPVKLKGKLDKGFYAEFKPEQALFIPSLKTGNLYEKEA